MDKRMNLGPWKFYKRCFAENEYILHHGQQKREAFRLILYWKSPSLATWLEKEIVNISSFQFLMVHLKRKHIAYYSTH